MTGAVKRRTTNFGFNIINYDFPRWHTYDWQNWDVVDAVLAAANLTSVRGIWENSVDYVPGDRIVDDTDQKLWVCSIAHTSASTGTFLADRTANPTYWTLVSSVPVYRGNWITATNYITQDIIQTANAYYLCVTTHTSGVFATDLAAGRWVLIVDASAAITASTNAANSASAAATSASNASTSATNAANSASSASTSASNAATSATNASNSATAAATAETNAETAETNAANSASAASSSASAADTSADNAATSETNAAASAAAAAADALNTVKVTAQAFSSPQKAQALTNLGVSTFAQTILDDASAAAVRATLLEPWEPIQVVTPSGGITTADFTTLSTSYKRFQLIIEGIAPVADDDYLFVVVQTGGSTWQNTGYDYSGILLGPGGSTAYGSGIDSITSLIALTRPNTVGSGVGNLAAESASGTMNFNLGATSDSYPMLDSVIRYIRSDGVFTCCQGGGRYGAAGAITGIRLRWSTGNFANKGTITLLGLR